MFGPCTLTNFAVGLSLSLLGLGICLLLINRTLAQIRDVLKHRTPKPLDRWYLRNPPKPGRIFYLNEDEEPGFENPRG